ncbi:hypothetical protein [Actinokineospora sp. NBRC 105648]|uniref:hypothetical protein n=1 Tax=Actinokineospora sp. NBRC 105648 TaxID=3032206 RepID=UPI0024A43D21|nr:hypothetical protein [Actinokineospora sp. NBRC 105648]GLZ43792.1 hypothetical protein Acsp05_74160 [Actinokineospora sp. NBRC 105648]
MNGRRVSPRFTDWTIVEESGSTGLVDDRRPFFGGVDVEARMGVIRRQINYIRENWDQYEQFMSDLAQRLRTAVATLGAEAELAQRLLSERRDWGKPGEVATDFSALKLYTSDAGYRALFGIVNDSFRRDSFLQDERIARSAVFLIELLTIDLFNYRIANPASDAFEGVVYRGMSVSNDDVDVFLNVMRQPVSQRFVSVPLGMLSSSTAPEVALRLAGTYATASEARTTVLWRIHVLDLGEELLDLYRRNFSTSVVTSICAVPITGVSHFPEENEVLLRGPFFQILDVAWQANKSGGPDHVVVDAVMLNSNRDHVTNIANDRGDDLAMRTLFRVLVTQRRARFAAKFATERGREDDGLAYQRQLDGSLAELRSLGIS